MPRATWCRSRPPRPTLTFTDERAGPNIYRVCGRDDQQGGVAGKYLATNFGDKNVAIVHDKTAYGKGLADETKKAMNEAGKEEVAVRGDHRRREGLFGARLQAEAGRRRCRLSSAAITPRPGLIVRQMRDQGMNTILMGGDALITQEYLVDHRRRRRRHADDLLARPAQEPGRRRGREALQGQGHRARGLCALHLCRDPGLEAGGGEGRQHRDGSDDGQGAERATSSTR